MRFIIILFFVFHITSLVGQEGTISGVVTSSKGELVPYASIFEKEQNIGVSTDIDGNFSIQLRKGKVDLIIAAYGFPNSFFSYNIHNDTSLNIVLTSLEDILDEVVVSGTMLSISKKDSPIPVEVYSAEYLKKVPTPSIFEATQNINGVRPQINCAVCNTGDIHINGMEGPYTMVTIDGMPLVGGLSTVYGLQGIPSSLLERVEVVKGAASTLYGSEAVAGLINVITKDVNSASDFAFESSATTWNEYQLDGHIKYKLGKVKSLFGASYYNYTKPIDNNGDNFTDVTLKDRISLFNKFSFKRKDNRFANILVRLMKEDRWGGEMQWDDSFRGGDSLYGESIYTNRIEVIGNYELPVKPRIIFSGSYSFHDQDSYYGTLSYQAKQHIGYGQVVWHQDINTRHTLLTGLALRYNHYDDNTYATEINDSPIYVNSPDEWILPGVFIQDNFKLNEKTKVLIGGRYDYHLKHGSIFTPRLNIKVDPTSKSEIRLGYGNGFRVVNLFTEDHAALTGARDVVVSEDLNPEISHNINLNYVKRINTNKMYMTLDASIFYTNFSNKITPDYETNDKQIIYSNLDGYAISQGISLNARMLFNFPLRINFGGTILDVYSMNKTTDDLLIREQQLFAEQYTGTWSVSYQIQKLKVSIDYTGSLYGPMKLPLVMNDFRDEFSKPFSLQNIKISKSFKGGLRINCGVRNLLNFTPPSNSILRAHDPFNKHSDDVTENPYGYEFDPTYIYSSFQGITFFGGVSYEFNKKK
jgi:outer membrane receptor for ferrienterochelin and colicins